jgi:hypothetical protein
VSRADQRPFSLSLDQAPQEKLTEAHGLLDLAKYELNHLFPESVWTSPSAPFQLVPHFRDETARLAVFRMSSGFGAVLLATGGKVGFDFSGGHALQVLLRAREIALSFGVHLFPWSGSDLTLGAVPK